jgi:peptidoglycan hydrolase-like protein with peptidoglycan-binding domain
VRGFVYGADTSYGATTTDITGAPFSTGAFSAAISSLTCNTGYHFAAYATSTNGIGYGSDLTFTTSACSSGGGGTVSAPVSSGGGGGGISYYGTLLINGGATTTTSQTITLSLNSNASQVWLSNDASFSTGGFVPLSSTLSWNLLPGSGLETVYARFGTGSSTVANARTAITLANGSTQVIPTSIPQTVSSTPTPQIPSSVFVLTTNHTLGATGSEVQALQQFLNSHGYTVATSGVGSPGKESMLFGALTQAALTKFQAANNISPAVGYFGPLTRSVISSLLGAPASSPESTVPAAASAPSQPTTTTVSSGSTRTLSIGLSGQDVSDLQTFLASQPRIYPNGRVTGYFGALTQKAVANFQFKYGIIRSADDAGYGIVGPKTRAKIDALK